MCCVLFGCGRRGERLKSNLSLPPTTTHLMACMLLFFLEMSRGYMSLNVESEEVLMNEWIMEYE